MHSLSKLKINDICQNCLVNSSNMHRIIKNFESWNTSFTLMTSVRWMKVINYPSVQKWIKEYIERESGWFTSLDIRNYVKKKLGVSVSSHQIRLHLKITNNLSFKKGSSLPIKSNTEKITLFKLSKELQEVKILINMDERKISK